MPSIRWLGRGAAAVRALRSRAERMRRLPFAIASAAAAVVFAATLDHDFNPDARVSEVPELPMAVGSEVYESDYTALEDRELEILEYGFSEVTVDGEDWIAAAAVIRNPHGHRVESGPLSVTATAEDGNPIRVQDRYFGVIQPETTVKIGFFVPGDATDLDLSELRVELLGFSFAVPEYEDLDPELRAVYGKPVDLPEVTTLEREALASPDGWRVHYRIATEARQAQLAVLFRDADGNLIGGFPAGPDLFETEVPAGWRWLPLGESEQYFDLREAWIPEGADLDRIEIGPSASTEV